MLGWLFQQLRQLLDVRRLANKINPRLLVVRLREVAVLLQGLLQLLLAHRRVEFNGVTFDRDIVLFKLKSEMTPKAVNPLTGRQMVYFLLAALGVHMVTSAIETITVSNASPCRRHGRRD